MPKIVSFNLNGIRSALKKGLSEYIAQDAANLYCFQELKIDQPTVAPLWQLFPGYHAYSYHAEKKGYSGVGVLSKQEPLNVEYGCGQALYDFEGRVIRLDFPDYSLLNVYLPSGTSGDARQAVKEEFLTFFLAYCKDVEKKCQRLIVTGDFNICHRPMDIHDPVRNAKSSGFLPQEREWLGQFIDAGFTDSYRSLNPDKVKYSWWSQRANSRAKNLGWRIDYVFCSDSLKDGLQHSDMRNDIVFSDHCPVETVLNF